MNVSARSWFYRYQVAFVAISLVAVFGLWASPQGRVQNRSADKSLEIGSRLELLIDDYLIETMNGASFKLHPPQLAETVLRFDAPWEGSGNHYITVFKDGELVRMYYRTVPQSKADPSGKTWEFYTAYAESKDGIHWTRPNLGIFEFKGSKQNNIIWRADGEISASGSANFAPFRDTNPKASPEERYKALGGIKAGLFLFVSPDGIHWKQKSDAPIITRDKTDPPMENAFDSHNVGFWDPLQGHYVIYIRDKYQAPETGERIRGIRRTTSPDFVHWSHPEWIDMGDAPSDQLYTNSITPYFRAPHIYLAFPKRYLPWRDAELPKMYDEMRGKGLSDSVFMSSRDGLHWDRRFLEAFVRPGANPLNWTDRSNYVAWGVVPTAPGEISVYVLQHWRLPSIHIRRGVLRTDGFVSINAPYKGGQLTTRPLIFRGKRLVINYATSAAGGLRTEILDPEGKPLAGYDLANSRELFGDAIEQVVSWDRGSDLSALAGRPVRLRFIMKDADLYSFQFH